MLRNRQRIQFFAHPDLEIVIPNQAHKFKNTGDKNIPGLVARWFLVSDYVHDLTGIHHELFQHILADTDAIILRL